MTQLYDWYKVYNLDTFNATGLVSKEITVFLDVIGEKTFLFTKGNYTAMLYDGVFLPLNLNLQNPYHIDRRAVYVDDNNDIWLGIATP